MTRKFETAAPVTLDETQLEAVSAGKVQTPDVKLSTNPGGNVLIGLLLPAVQKVR